MCDIPRQNRKRPWRGQELKNLFLRFRSDANSSRDNFFSEPKLLHNKKQTKILLSTKSMTTFSEKSFREDSMRREETKVSIRDICHTLNNNMTHLSIESRPLDRNFVKCFESCPFQSLRVLSLNANQFYRDKSSFRKLLQSLPETLEELSLCWNGMDEQTAEILAKRLPYLRNITSLRLCGNPLGVRGLRVLLEEGNLNRIRHVDLSDCDLGNEGVFRLAQFLHGSKIQRLILKMNGIGKTGVTCLANALATNQSLTTLHLHCNEIDDSGVHILMTSLSIGMSNLRDLSLSANLINESGAKEIANMLHRTNLRRLYLDHNFIGDNGVQYLAKVLKGNIRNQKLEELSLASNDLSNKSLSVMADSLATNRTLYTLLLGNNPRVDRRGASTFVKCLEVNNYLSTLEILEENYENHLLNGKIQLHLELNYLRRTYMGNVSITDSAWPNILEGMTRVDLLYFLLRGRPDIYLSRRTARAINSQITL